MRIINAIIHWVTIFETITRYSVWCQEKSCPPLTKHQHYFFNEVKIKILSQKQKLKEYVTNIFSVKEILNEHFG